MFFCGSLHVYAGQSCNNEVVQRRMDRPEGLIQATTWSYEFHNTNTTNTTLAMVPR